MIFVVVLSWMLHFSEYVVFVGCEDEVLMSVKSFRVEAELKDHIYTP